MGRLDNLRIWHHR